MRTLGVDGCRAGWVAHDGRAATLHASFAALAAAEPDALLAVDIPIGLLADGRTGDRACDKAARARLGPRRASVFPPPTRAQLVAGRAPTRQTTLILPKIGEVDAHLAAHPGARVHEAHPELAFALAAGAPMAQSKRTAEGRAARRTVLRRLGIEAGPAPRGAKEDDVLDAAILSWTAVRIARGEALRVGEGPWIWA